MAFPCVRLAVAGFSRQFLACLFCQRKMRPMGDRRFLAAKFRYDVSRDFSSRRTALREDAESTRSHHYTHQGISGKRYVQSNLPNKE